MYIERNSPRMVETAVLNMVLRPICGGLIAFITHSADIRRFLIALTAISMCLCSYAADAVKLSTGEYEPFTSEKLPEGGPFADIVKRAFSESGYGVKVDFLPWKRGYAEALGGQFDGTFPYARTVDREKDFMFSESFYTVDRRMYYRSESGVNPEDIATLKGKQFCSPLGFTIYKEVSGLVESKELSVQSPPDLVSCAKMLSVGRVDFFVATADVADVVLEKADMKGKFLNKLFGKNENFLIVPKANPKAQEIIAAFNKGVAALKTKGELGKILKKHKL